jgi:phenylacetate-CoA ligase
MQSREPIAFPRFLPEQQLLVRDLYRQMRAFETAPAEEQRATQAAQLSRLLMHAHAHSPFWRARIDTAGIDPARVDNVACLASLPILTRADVQEHAPAMRARTANMTEADLVVHSTSGSTGQPVRVEKLASVYVPLYQAMELVDQSWHGRDPRKTLGVCIPGIGVVDDGVWGPPVAWFEQVGRAYAFDFQRATPEDLYERLVRHRPAYVSIPPVGVLALAEAAELHGGAPTVEQFITSMGTVTPAVREAARTTFGARVTDRYSCEECGLLALQCPQHDHYHVAAATVIIEVVDDDGAACPPGKMGRVLITCLHGYAMPLIRYELGDLAAWGAPCDCGITLPVLKEVAGRTRDLITMPDGKRRVLVANLGFLGIPNVDVRQHEVRLYTCGTAELRVRCRQPLGADGRERLRAILAGLVGEGIPIVVTETHDLSWAGNAKRRDLVRMDIPFIAVSQLS